MDKRVGAISFGCGVVVLIGVLADWHPQLSLMIIGFSMGLSGLVTLIGGK